MSREGMLGRLPLALYGLPNDRLTEAFELIKLLGDKDGPAWVAHLRRTRWNGLPDQVTTESVVRPSILKLANPNVELDRITFFNPSGFERDGHLMFTDDFELIVKSKAEPVGNLDAITLSSFFLIRNTYDSEIRADPNMPENYKFKSKSGFIAYLYQIIQKQRYGEEGDLLNNGSYNIFYVAGHVVSVRWVIGYLRWEADIWKLGGIQWDAFCRVFSRN